MQNNSGAIDLTKIGLLAPGANPLTPSDEKGINEILRGRVHLNDGSSVTTFVKLLSKKQLINELFGAELARAVGMPVPEVFLVRIDKCDYEPLFTQHRIQSDSIVSFGSKDVGVKSLARRYQAEGEPFKKWFVKHCSLWKRVVSFDCWIANIDRHLGNALIGGPDEFWLIDHGHCFTGPTWIEQNLIPDSFFPNRLVDELSTVISSETRQAIITESANAQRIFNLADVEGILSDSHSIDFLSASESSALIYFIEKRKSKIVEFVCSAIGLPLLPL
jgi:hypothetical protein